MKLPTMFIVFGALMVLGGILALANPFAASLAVTTLVGIFLLIGGVGQLWAAFSTPDDAHRMLHGFLGLMTLILGVMLTADPVAGTLSLTLIVGILFLLNGAARLGIAFRIGKNRYFWLLVLSGVLSALIGILVLGNVASAATSLLGILLGIQLLAEGAALIALGVVSRQG
jgi:membrane protein HdeD